MYQLVVVGRRVVGVSVGDQEQLAVGVDGEETQEVLDPAPYKVSDRLGLGLRQGLGPAVDFGAAVRRHPDGCERERIKGSIPCFFKHELHAAGMK